MVSVLPIKAIPSIREVRQRDGYGENQERDLTMDALQKARRKVVVVNW